MNSNAKEKAAKESADKSAGKRDKGKRRGTSSNNVRVPKKMRHVKSCALCQKYGDAHTTHSTGECRKYDKDGTLQKSFSAKAPLDRSATAAVRKNRKIPSRRLWNASRNLRKRSKRATKVPERRNVATNTATLVIPTPNRIVGTVVL